MLARSVLLRLTLALPAACSSPQRPAATPEATTEVPWHSCDLRREGALGAVLVEEGAARAWVEANRERVASNVSDASCGEAALAFVAATDFARWQVLVSAGHAAAEPNPNVLDDGRSVTLTHGQVCGGAYPQSQLTLLRVPAGRAVAHRRTDRECPRDVP
ncbi:MAG TPA: hypothetical protein VK427_03320 [Kofleriaceae bacterium]|nr:hypothetical protein [Kofleriaceae bacterium]